jgi:hypothetical protein
VNPGSKPWYNWIMKEIKLAKSDWATAVLAHINLDPTNA